MALGRNLKKQQLIPDEEKASSASAKAAKKEEKEIKKPEKPKAKKGKVASPAAKPTAKKEMTKKSTAKKPTAKKPVNKKAVKKEVVEQVPVEHEVVGSPKVEAQEAPKVYDREPAPYRYISQAEKQRREKLKIKFAEEINRLRGKRVHLIVFRLGAEEYAIEIGKTREVVVTPNISKAPHAPDYVRGVADIRGSVIMAIDLAQKFRLTHATENKDRIPPYTLVLNHALYRVGILIDEVPVTLVVEGDRINSSSGVMTEDSIHETFIKGVIKEKDRMIFYVDIDGLLESDGANVLPEAVETTE